MVSLLAQSGDGAREAETECLEDPHWHCPDGLRRRSLGDVTGICDFLLYVFYVS